MGKGNQYVHKRAEKEVKDEKEKGMHKRYTGNQGIHEKKSRWENGITGQNVQRQIIKLKQILTLNI